MAGNDGSWFATFRLGLGRRFASCVIYIPAIPSSTLPLGFHVTYVATWREKTIFENISLLPAHRCGIPSSYQPSPIEILHPDSSYRHKECFPPFKKKKKEISSSRKIRMGRVSSTSFLVDKISSLHRKFILARVEENRARSLGTNRCLFFPLSVFAGERVRFSQFAPWPRKIAIGLGNTFTTGPGPVILLPEDFFSLYTLSESLLSFFFFLPFGILAFSRPFVSLIRFKRLWGPSIHIPPDFPE